MTIYRDSKRIVGTNADRVGVPVISGGWKEIGRTTLGSAGDTISVSSLADKRYLMILTNQYGTGGDTVSQLGLGNSSIDTGSNYARRASNNGGVDSTVTGRSYIFESMDVTQAGMFGVDYIANKSDKEKLGIRHLVYQNTAGAGNAPKREENYGKWSNTSNVIDIIQDKNTAAGSFDTGSEIVVLGYDPDDTHTDNFWEQLATASGTGSSLDTGTFTAKKYLWVQCFCDGTSSTNINYQFNGDTGTNYADRESINGGTDATGINNTTTNNLTNTGTGTFFTNMFIVNNSSNEKLWINHGMQATTGAGNAPARRETVGKWTNTSDQITRIVANSAFGTDSFIKVWGSN